MWLGSARTLTVAGVLASTGGAVVGARSLLTGQAEQARSIIPKALEVPPRADGIYAPGGATVRPWERGRPFDMHLMVFGDSTATGYGCRHADEVPGVLIARGLAELSGNVVRLSTKAIVGATSRGLASQVDAMLVAGPPPDAAVIMIGANDVTTLNGIGPSARRLGAAVRRLRACGTAVVVGTCPDFGVITAIPQPLRWTARSAGIRLARAQAAEVAAAGVCRSRSPICSRRISSPSPNGCSPRTTSTRRPRATRWPLSSCCRRCARPLAKPLRSHNRGLRRSTPQLGWPG
jgi:lysophospholipase L1-like esterase